MNGREFVHILLIVTSLLLWQNVSSQASSKEQLFQQGNEAYSRGDYAQAITQYEELTATFGLSPAVLFNLANSYAQDGKIGRAILNYERALRLAPGESDIVGNLDLVRKERGLFVSEPKGAGQFFNLLSLNQWAMLGLLALVCFTLFQVAKVKFHTGGKMSTGLGLALALALCLAVTGMATHYQHFKPAVVTAADARLLISPFASATSVGAIQEGRLVYPEKTHGTFTYVEDETSRHGWILSTDIEGVSK